MPTIVTLLPVGAGMARYWQTPRGSRTRPPPAATAATQASAVTNQIPQIVRELGGLELELAKLNQVALSQGVTLYDVEVRGEIDRASSLVPLRRTIHATWDSTWVPQQTSRITTKLPNSEGNNGGWLYLREE